MADTAPKTIEKKAALGTSYWSTPSGPGSRHHLGPHSFACVHHHRTGRAFYRTASQ